MTKDSYDPEAWKAWGDVGTYDNPVKLTGPIPEEYPAEFMDRPYIYVQETDGQITKVYRSYSDYCD